MSGEGMRFAHLIEQHRQFISVCVYLCIAIIESGARQVWQYYTVVFSLWDTMDLLLVSWQLFSNEGVNALFYKRIAMHLSGRSDKNYSVPPHFGTTFHLHLWAFPSWRWQFESCSDDRYMTDGDGIEHSNSDNSATGMVMYDSCVYDGEEGGYDYSKCPLCKPTSQFNLKDRSPLPYFQNHFWQ